MELSEILYNAITNSQAVTSLLRGGVYDTCVPVPPTEADNTPLPYIVVTEEAYHNNLGTKDSVWEGDRDLTNASVIINADTPAEVRRLRRLIRKAVAEYANIVSGYIYLQSANNDGIAWDWTRPCYYDTLHYQADMDVVLDDEPS